MLNYGIMRCDPFAGFCGGISMTSSDVAQLTLRAENGGGEAPMKAFQVQGIKGTKR